MTEHHLFTVAQHRQLTLSPISCSSSNDSTVDGLATALPSIATITSPCASRRDDPARRHADPPRGAGIRKYAQHGHAGKFNS